MRARNSIGCSWPPVAEGSRGAPACKAPRASRPITAAGDFVGNRESRCRDRNAGLHLAKDDGRALTGIVGHHPLPQLGGIGGKHHLDIAVFGMRRILRGDHGRVLFLGIAGDHPGLTQIDVRRQNQRQRRFRQRILLRPAARFAIKDRDLSGRGQNQRPVALIFETHPVRAVNIKRARGHRAIAVHLGEIRLGGLERVEIARDLVQGNLLGQGGKCHGKDKDGRKGERSEFHVPKIPFLRF